MKNGHGRPGLPYLFQRILARLPQFCCFCHQKTDTGRDLCRFCQTHLPRISQKLTNSGSTVCLQCGLEWPWQEEQQQCANCAKFQSAIDQIICPYLYGFPIDQLIGRLKYSHHLATGRLLGSLLAEQVGAKLKKAEYPDFLLPVPLNSERYRVRGFNHALEIARYCGKELNIPVLVNASGRHIDTGSLAGLSRAERGLRIRGAFWVSESLRGARVAIVDDVLTTGATSGELATELLDSQVDDIQLWVVARTPVTGTDGAS